MEIPLHYFDPCLIASIHVVLVATGIGCPALLALDGVTLQAPKAARVELLRMAVNDGTIELTVAATPGAQVQVDRSFNLQTWEPASVFAITEPEQILNIPFDERSTTSLFLRIAIP